ncbi:MAG TPA: DUF1343 domain-containing protein [Longimicrobiales bacterium]
MSDDAAHGTGGPAPRGRRAYSLTTLLLAALLGCGVQEVRGAREEGTLPVVRLGIDVLLSDSLHLLRGRRVGLITNQTGRGRFSSGAGEPGSAGPGSATRASGLPGVSTIDLLYRHPAVELVALFSPEHGIRGVADPGASIASGRDAATGLPIYSLYGRTRKPTAEMLEGIDVLVFDIQDIGTRYYTYVWTMALAMQAAAEHRLDFVVLDRPNPLGGHLVQGNILDTAYASFVGLYPVPMRHGLTAGELARFLNAEHGIGAELVVVPMQGWRREQWYDQTGLPWIPPSPNMPSLESATHYPGTCLFEGTNLSVGRGTRAPFQQIGAPWLDAETLVRRLNAYGLPGVRFEPVRFTPAAPGDGKFDGVAVRGIRFIATDRDRYDPTRAAVAALIEIRRLHPDRLTWRTAHFDRLAGTDRLRKRITAGATLEEVTAHWSAERAAFVERRAKYLLYR